MALYPSNFQVVGESGFDLCCSITTSTGARKATPSCFTLGRAVCLYPGGQPDGQLPLRLIPLPQGELIAATGDFNVPAALAVFYGDDVFLFRHQEKGLSYFKHYIQLLPVFLPFNILEDFTRPFSLMFSGFMPTFWSASCWLALCWGGPVRGPFFDGHLSGVVRGHYPGLHFCRTQSAYIALSAEDH
ncbi:MAG: F0F1 ATP synthase subunit A [Vampirovibrionales bacterium]